MFLLAALIYFLHFAAWGLTSLLGSDPWLGYLIVARPRRDGGARGLHRRPLLRKGVPPTPQMAIEEGKLIRETLRRIRQPSSEGHAP